MNFAKFHARGGRGLQRAHPEVGIPLPPAHPRRGARRPSWRGGLCYGWGLPGGGRGLRVVGLPTTGRRGRGGRLPQTRRLRGARWARLPGAGEYRGGGLPGQTGRFPGQTRRISGRLPGAGRYRRRGWLPVPGRGVYRGAATPAGGAAAQPTPRRGGYPAAAPPAKITVFRRLVTGSRRARSLCAFPRRGYPAARRKKIFFSGRGFLCRNTASRILRAYIEAGRPGGATWILIRQKPPEKLVLLGTCFFRRSE